MTVLATLDGKQITVSHFYDRRSRKYFIVQTLFPKDSEGPFDSRLEARAYERMIADQFATLVRDEAREKELNLALPRDHEKAVRSVANRFLCDVDRWRLKFPASPDTSSSTQTDR